jgi:hypothetical protein
VAGKRAATSDRAWSNGAGTSANGDGNVITVLGTASLSKEPGHGRERERES